VNRHRAITSFEHAVSRKCLRHLSQGADIRALRYRKSSDSDHAFGVRITAHPRTKINTVAQINDVADCYRDAV